MCLSNVYDKSPDADHLIFRNIADVRFEGNTLVMRKQLSKTIPASAERTT